MALDFHTLSIRTVSGLVYAGLLVGAIVLGPLAAAILFSVFAFFASYELEVNTIGKDNHGSDWTWSWLLDAAALSCLIFSYVTIDGGSALPVFLLIAFVALRFVTLIFMNQHQPLASISIFTFEQFYIGAPLLLLVYIISLVSNPWIVVCAISMIWINDTGAYIVGSLIGRHKMSRKLSPKKSWEGFWGGLIFNIGAAFIFFYCFKLDGNLVFDNVQGWIFIGICVTAFATLGDLFESMLKRSLGIKDFGSIIPGHGGVLDRIDSLLFVVPGVLIALKVAQLMFGLT